MTGSTDLAKRLPHYTSHLNIRRSRVFQANEHSSYIEALCQWGTRGTVDFEPRKINLEAFARNELQSLEQKLSIMCVFSWRFKRGEVVTLRQGYKTKRYVQPPANIKGLTGPCHQSLFHFS